tara:strand:- start:502 stop:669 length:168 start_codon:yes stop_codon:yes gene_type:complete
MKMLKTVWSLALLATVVMVTQVQSSAAQIPDDGLSGPQEPHPAADEAIARIKSPY